MAVQMTSQPEPTVLDSAWRFRWMVLLLALGFAGLGWLYADNSEQWTAEATLAVRDPLATNLFGELVPEDATRLLKESRTALALDEVCPYRFRTPMAPALPDFLFSGNIFHSV